IALMWPSGAMVGQWLGNVIDADLLGLDAAFPIILFCLIRGDLKNRATLSLTVAGILIAVALTPLLPLGLGAVTSLSVFVLVAAGWAAAEAGLRTRAGILPTRNGRARRLRPRQGTRRDGHERRKLPHRPGRAEHRNLSHALRRGEARSGHRHEGATVASRSGRFGR